MSVEYSARKRWRSSLARNGEERRHPTVALLDVHVLPDPQLAPVDGDGGKFPVRDGDAVGDLFLVERDALRMVVAAHEVEIHPADDPRLVGLEAEQARRDRVGVGEDAVSVDAVDAVARALDEHAISRLALGERVGDLLALRDVARHHGHTVLDAYDLVPEPSGIPRPILDLELFLERLPGLDDAHDPREE